MPSFDTVCEPNMVEVRNAVDTSAKEIGTRFDFKGTSANIELKDKEITMFGDAEFQLTQVEDILRNKLTKRNVDVRFLDIGKVEKIGGDKVKQVIKVKNGIETEDAKKDHQTDQGKQDQGASVHSGRCGARDRCQARRLARSHGPAAQGHDRVAAVVRQLQGLKRSELSPWARARPKALRAQA
jgi:uncharacterized protein YajQ (UPF0234 family)